MPWNMAKIDMRFVQWDTHSKTYVSQSLEDLSYPCCAGLRERLG